MLACKKSRGEQDNANRGCKEMCESVVVRHYNKEKRGELLKNMHFSWRMSDRCTKEYFIQSKIHKMNKEEPVHIEQCYGETIEKTRK